MDACHIRKIDNRDIIPPPHCQLEAGFHAVDCPSISSNLDNQDRNSLFILREVHDYNLCQGKIDQGKNRLTCIDDRESLSIRDGTSGIVYMY